MRLTRRSALKGLLVAPAIIRTPGLLMPIKPLVQFHWAELNNFGGWADNPNAMAGELLHLRRGPPILRNYLTGFSLIGIGRLL
jgi:hypothetical protein